MPNKFQEQCLHPVMYRNGDQTSSFWTYIYDDERGHNGRGTPKSLTEQNLKDHIIQNLPGYIAAWRVTITDWTDFGVFDMKGGVVVLPERVDLRHLPQPDMKAVIERMSFKYSAKILADACPLCRLPIWDGSFDTMLDRTEFTITGICQRCIDIAFDDPGEEE